jgi:regulator of cell morphogenesis and NO signaling
MTIQTTLNEFVQANMHSSSLFEQVGLDTCCGGQKTLEEACAEKGLDPNQILEMWHAGFAAVEEPSSPTEPEDGSLTEWVEHIVETHHNYLKEAFPRLAGLMEKVVTQHSANHPELQEVRKIFTALRNDLEPHLQKEEQVLFPMIRKLEEATGLPQFHCGSIRNPIRVMLMEHEQAGELLTSLEEITQGYQVPEDGCESYRSLYQGLKEFDKDTREHIQKENEKLFPQVLEKELNS